MLLSRPISERNHECSEPCFAILDLSEPPCTRAAYSVKAYHLLTRDRTAVRASFSRILLAAAVGSLRTPYPWIYHAGTNGIREYCC
ncbi:hypothetical protein TNCV_3969131 [Trichonephila clavipes]|nr:hypothetical protein TNCV_3969131 [Trichonephila clavipes]